MPYHVRGESSGAAALMRAWSCSASARSSSVISAILASTAASPSASEARPPPRPVAAGAAAAVLVLPARPPTRGRAATDHADPLAFMPSRAPVVLDLDTKAPLVALAVQQLAPRLTGGRLSADAVQPLLGGR